MLRRYSEVKRNAIQQFQAEIYFKHHPTKEYSPEFEPIRESLLEHVGMLPVLAMYFYPYCEEEVDIGRVLQILAIHDIGELEIGDESTFTKDHDNNQGEIDAAFKLLDPSQHELYMEFENLETIEAKYAKTIEKLVGDFYDLFADKDDSSPTPSIRTPNHLIIPPLLI